MGFLNDRTKQWHQAGVQVVRLFYLMFSLLVYLFFSDTLVNLMPGNCQKSKTKEKKSNLQTTKKREAFPPLLLEERRFYVIDYYLSMHAVTNGLSIYRDEMSEKSRRFSRIFLLLNK